MCTLANKIGKEQKMSEEMIGTVILAAINYFFLDEICNPFGSIRVFFSVEYLSKMAVHFSSNQSC